MHSSGVVSKNDALIFGVGPPAALLACGTKNQNRNGASVGAVSARCSGESGGLGVEEAAAFSYSTVHERVNLDLAICSARHDGIRAVQKLRCLEDVPSVEGLHS